MLNILSKLNRISTLQFSCLTRSARKSITEEVKRRLPRKPWMEVNCPAEVRELVYRTRKPRKTKEKTPTKSDHIVSDGEKPSPVKNEVVDAGSPQFPVNDEKPDEKPAVVGQGGDPPRSITPEKNIGIATDKEAVTPVDQVASGDSGTPGKIGGSGGTIVDEPIVIDD